jgi:hypothetical protein
MAKGIASYPKHEQAKVAARRLQSNSQGLGYWSAVDAQKGAIRRALIQAGLIKPSEKSKG